ncbi:MAG: zf-TFIIB domain-containing protein [Nitrospirae bacterium]|nr:zf-TFIIB domain-containing protein [Nitrospirota bacterium]
MARCSNCNAPLPDGSIVCAYCGDRNDVDLKGIHYYTTHESDESRTCPRCNNTILKTIDLKLTGKFLIERCEQCLGFFFNPGELEALLDATVNNVWLIDNIGLDSINLHRKPDPYPVAYIKCPVCSKLMNRVNYGAKSGVILDSCKAHGVWLDSGELRHLFEWVKLGGRLLEKERQEQRRIDEEKKLNELRKEIEET